MTISELAKLTIPDDIKLAAEIHGCTLDYVRKVLTEVRVNQAIVDTVTLIVDERKRLKEALLQRAKQEAKA